MILVATFEIRKGYAKHVRDSLRDLVNKLNDGSYRGSGAWKKPVKKVSFKKQPKE